jgi:hypothetical protein
MPEKRGQRVLKKSTDQVENKQEQKQVEKPVEKQETKQETKQVEQVGKRNNKRNLKQTQDVVEEVKVALEHPVEHSVEHPLNHPLNHPVEHPVNHVNNKFLGVSEELEKELKFKVTLNELREKINGQTQTLKDLKTSLRRLETSYDHDMNKAVKLRRKRRNGDDKPTGFIKQIALSKDLADLIGEKENTMMAMPEYTRKFFKMLKDNNLLYDGDGRVFRANDKIKKVFGLPDSVNDSTNHRDETGFNLYNLQKHISKVNKNHVAVNSN